jgi:hypothetical protein
MRLDFAATGDKVTPMLKEADEFIEDLQGFLPGARDWDWKDPKKRVIGYVVLSPPIARNVLDTGFTED